MITLNRAINEKVKKFVRQPHEMGYPLLLVMIDGGCVCHKCAKENFKLILSDSRHGWATEWTAAELDVFWEGEETCANCNNVIHSAYGPIEEN